MKKHRMKDELENITRRSVPEDINLWPNISAQLERNSPMLTPRTRPVMAILLAIFTLLALSGAAYALGRTLGYLPGYGLVDSTSGLRVLAEPVSVTRDGVTLTISSVFVYPDHVEVIYDVIGLAPENDSIRAADAATNPTAFCGGVNIGDSPNTEGDARLQLPDGTVLERVQTNKYPQNVFAQKPVYEAAIPASVTKMTLVLDCLPFARRGAAPEGWSVPFELKSVPAGTVIGEPVIEVQPTAVQPVEKPTTQEDASLAAPASAIPVRPVTMTLTRIVPLDSYTVVYLSMDMENKDPSLVSILPLDVYAIDSQGQKTRMRGNYAAWMPFEHRVGSEFEYVTQSKPAPGPLTIVVEKAIAYYAPGHVDPPQVKPSDLEFTFDAGENPQVGQTWALDNTIEIAGYPLKVTSVQATNWDNIKTPNYIDGSQGYEFGYDFTVETDPSVKMQVMMDIMSESPTCSLRNYEPDAPYTASLHSIQLCREKFPTGNVKVQIWQLAVLLENTWQATWQP